MRRLGIICPSANGHLNPICALGRELRRRGHKVVLFGVPDISQKVENAGLEFVGIGAADYPPGSIEEMHSELGLLTGLRALRFAVRWFQKVARMLFREAPDALRAANIEGLLVDQVSSAGGTIADRLGLPFVTVCNGLLLNREKGVPPYFTPWSYGRSSWARLRNRLGNAFIDHFIQPIREVIAGQRREWSLPPYSCTEDAYSKLAQISQLPREFDFPRLDLPPCVHYTGPLLDPSGFEPISSPSEAFPFEEVGDKPVIYASLGTLQNRRWDIFESIAAACQGLDVQLVISLGNPGAREPMPHLPGSPVVLPYASHQKMIRRSSLVITHGGLNTVLGALSDAVPVVAIPITHEQPGIAARLSRSGAGEVVPYYRLKPSRLRSAIDKTLRMDRYRESALRLKRAIQRSGGVCEAADIAEQAISTSTPVMRENRSYRDRP